MIQVSSDVKICELLLYGEQPQPAGSKKAFVPLNPKTRQPFRDANGRIVVNVIDDNPKTKAWQAFVKHCAQRRYTGAPQSGGLSVQFCFLIKRPKYHYGTGKNENTVKEQYKLALPTSRPDVLKLSRGVEDALTGVLWDDDSQIVRELISKEYADDWGLIVTLRPFVVEEKLRVSLEIYELLKRYRTVTDNDRSSVVGILSQRETWLYDELCRLTDSRVV